MDCVKTLNYYFQQLWEEAGLKWDSDNFAEIEYIVEEIIEESVKRCVEQLSGRLNE